jgi:hypothetical protein
VVLYIESDRARTRVKRIKCASAQFFLRSVHICSTLLLAYVLYGSAAGWLQHPPVCSRRQVKLGLDAALVVGADWTTAGRQIPRLGMAPDLPVDAPPISVEDTPRCAHEVKKASGSQRAAARPSDTARQPVSVDAAPCPRLSA